MPRNLAALAIVLLCFVPLSARALIPPLEGEELKKSADLIVLAKVVEVTAQGPMKEDHCYGWQTYRARVLVEKTEKGQAEGKEIQIIYRTRVKNEKKCVGGAHNYHLSQNSRYRLYLQRSKDQKTKKIHYHFYHRQCIESP